MVRNSKRKAFTIVELVIVIAVIAILAAVMIPTFSGIIENADVSADRQKLDAVNKQIRIYIDTVNQKDITTGEELRAALSGEGTATGVNFFEQFNPQSAKYGYHYWFDEAKQEVVLSKMESLTQAAVPGKMIVRADSVAREGARQIAPHDPRSFTFGFYFLDQSGNEIADLFAAIDNLSAEANLDAYTEKRDAVEALIAKGGDNGQLAENLIERLNATTILSGNAPIVAVPETQYLHIPANKTNNNDYTLQGVSSTVNLHAAFNPNITIPENVKTGDALNAFNEALKGRNQEFHVSVEGNFDTTDTTAFAAKIKDIFGVGSVNGTITVNGNITGNTSDGINIEFTGKIEINVKLDYKNPVTEEFALSVKEGFAYNNYVALHKIQEEGFQLLIKNTADLTGKNGEATYVSYYQDLTWKLGTIDENGNFVETDIANVNISDEGVLTFAEGFNDSTITLQATPVAVNDVATAPKAVITLNVVELSKVEFKFDGSATVDLSKDPKVPFLVDYGTSQSQFTDFDYTYVLKGTQTVVDGLDWVKLGTPVPSVTVSENNAHITINPENYKLTYSDSNIKTTILSGAGYVSENVTVTVGAFTKTYEVRIEPTLFASALPTYNSKINFTNEVKDDNHVYVDHAYTIGNANSITLGKLFQLTDLVQDGDTITNIKVQTWHATGMSEGAPAGTVTETTNENAIGTVGADWQNHAITLTDLDTNWISISTNTELVYIYVDVVEGLNIYSESDFINKDYSASGNKALADRPATQSIVLHSNLTFTGYANKEGGGDCLRIMDGATMYGNYYVISAPDFRDKDASDGKGTDTGDGHSLISANNSTFNQVIIDGPVYHRSALSAANQGLSYSLFGITLIDIQTNPDGFFAYGIMSSGDTVMNDSYISGFNSPIRVTGTLTANNTVFDGGAWSNIFVNKASAITLTDCKTIQNVNGYTSTQFGKNSKVKGMGIYIHGKTQKNEDSLTITLNNTQQYNYLSKSDKGKYDTFMNMAINEVYGGDIPDIYKHGDYINAGIMSLGIDIKIPGKQETFDLYTKDKITVNGTTGQAYVTTPNPTDGGATLGSYGYTVNAQVYSNAHSTSDCGCASVNYTCSAADFRAARVVSASQN